VSEQTVLIEPSGRVCTLTMNRPRKLNAFNFEMGRELLAAFERIAADENIRVVILQGAGGHFSSGADMALLAQDIPSPEHLQGMKRLSKLIQTMRGLPQPIICKVRGVAYGVGANLTLAGDLTVAADNARICEVFVNIGVIMDGGGHYFLPRRVGLAKALELALLGDEISGREAAALGLIHRAVPEEELDRAVETLAAKLAQKSLPAMALIKEGLEGSLDLSLSEALEWEASHQSIMLQTKEHKEAVRRFLTSRKKKDK